MTKSLHLSYSNLLTNIVNKYCGEHGAVKHNRKNVELFRLFVTYDCCVWLLRTVAKILIVNYYISREKHLKR